MIINEDEIKNYLTGIDNINTQKTYKASLNNFLKFTKITHNTHIQQNNINRIFYLYKAYLLKRYKNAKTINQHMMIAKTFIKDYSNLKINRLKLLKTERIDPQYLTKDQLTLVLEYINKDLDSLIIRLLAYTGLRISEALSIKKEQLDKTNENGDAIVTIIGKNTKKRVIVIPSKLTKDLQQYSKNNNSQYIFQSRNKKNTPITPRTIQRHLKQIATELDKKYNTTLYTTNLKPHNLRHSFAVYALQENQINYVKEFLGHESIKTTQIYTNLKQEDVIKRFSTIGEYAN